MAPGSSLGSMLSGRIWYESLLVLTRQVKVLGLRWSGWMGHVPSFAPIAVAGVGSTLIGLVYVVCCAPGPRDEPTQTPTCGARARRPAGPSSRAWGPQGRMTGQGRRMALGAGRGISEEWALASLCMGGGALAHGGWYIMHSTLALQRPWRSDHWAGVTGTMTEASPCLWGAVKVSQWETATSTVLPGNNAMSGSAPSLRAGRVSPHQGSPYRRSRSQGRAAVMENSGPAPLPHPLEDVVLLSSLSVSLPTPPPEAGLRGTPLWLGCGWVLAHPLTPPRTSL